MPTLPNSTTYEEWLSGCDWASSANVADVVSHRYTELAISDRLLQRMAEEPINWVKRIGAMFPEMVFPDGQGRTQITERIHYPHIPSGIQRFHRKNASGAVTGDGIDASDCFHCYGSIPGIGYSKQEMEMFETNLKTQPFCIKSVRHVRDYKQWVDAVVNVRYKVEEQVRADFMTLVLLRTTGNKITLEAGHSQVGSNVRALLARYPSTFNQPFFPTPEVPGNVEPLTFDVLSTLRQRMINDGVNFSKTIAGRANGDAILKIWVDADWMLYNVWENPALTENMRYHVPANLFERAWRYDSTGDSEVYKGICPQVMGDMPRYAWNADTGGVTMVQKYLPQAIELGTEPVLNPDWENAPFGVAIIPCPGQAKVLGRPVIAEAYGIPILPIDGNGVWIARNEYDKECNPEKNMPFFQWNFEKGFAPQEPEGAVAILYRRTKPRAIIVPNCDLYPVIAVTPEDLGCGTDTSIACQNREPVSANITGPADPDVRDVYCTTALDGNPRSGSRYWYRITVEARWARLGIAVGDTFKLVLDNGDEVDAKMEDRTFGYPKNVYFISVGASLSTHFIKSIVPYDATPLVGNVVGVADSTTDGYDLISTVAIVTLDSPLSCEVGATVSVAFNSGSPLSATITTAEPELARYKLTFGVPILATTQDGWTTVTCP